jgi:hypothetical protein
MAWAEFRGVAVNNNISYYEKLKHLLKLKINYEKLGTPYKITQKLNKINQET